MPIRDGTAAEAAHFFIAPLQTNDRMRRECHQGDAMLCGLGCAHGVTAALALLVLCRYAAERENVDVVSRVI